jgi:hypothetical protein
MMAGGVPHDCHVCAIPCRNEEARKRFYEDEEREELTGEREIFTPEHGVVIMKPRKIMTVNDLIDGLKKLVDQGKGDYEIELPYCVECSEPSANDEEKVVYLG